MTFSRLARGLLVAPVLFACTSKDDDKSTSFKFTPTLARIDVTNADASFRLNDQEFLTNKVTFSSLLYPIGSINITDSPSANSTASGNNGFPVYECAGTSNDECLVELAGGTALENLLKDATEYTAKVGTFDRVAVSPCFKGGVSEDVRFKATAQAEIDGVTYYTNVATGLSLTGPAEEVTFSPNGGCSAVYPLLEKIVITEDAVEKVSEGEDGAETTEPVVSAETIPVKLYFDIANVASASGGTSNSGAGVPTGICHGASAQTPNICVNFPAIAATVDTASPTVSRFLVEEQPSITKFEATIFGFYKGSGGRIFGAYTRPYFSDRIYGLRKEFLIGPAFKSFAPVAENVFAVKAIYDWMVFPEFKMETHEGVVTIMDRGQGDDFSNPTEYSYKATVLP